MQWCLAYPAILLMLHAAAALLPDQDSPDTNTATPIRHVIVIIGENRSFDSLFATYVPRRGRTVWNLYSEGIVRTDGTPGPNFSAAAQAQGSDPSTSGFLLNPVNKTSYMTLPAPNTGGAPQYSSNTNPPPFETLSAAAAAEPALVPSDLPKLLTGATGLPNGMIDTRLANYASLPNGPSN